MAKQLSKKQIKKNRQAERSKETAPAVGKETSISGELSRTLMIVNLFGTILVIAAHYNSQRFIPFSEMRGWNYTLQEFTLNGIFRMVIPFFAMSSGFFLAGRFMRKEKYLHVMLNKAKTLLLPYVIASLAIYTFLRIMDWRPYPMTPVNFAVDVIFHPISVQFWFLRDLIILTVISPLLLGIPKIIKMMLVPALGVLWFIDYQPFPIFTGWYLLNIETIFFFCLGGLLFEYIPLIDAALKMKLPYKVLIVLAWLILGGIRVYIYPDFNLWYVNHYNFTSLMLYKAVVILAIIPMMQFSSLFASNRVMIYLSGFAFYAYLFHLVPLYDFLSFYNKLTDPEYSFYLNFPFVLTVMFVTGYVISKFLPRFFEFITGGRDPNKMLTRIN